MEKELAKKELQALVETLRRSNGRDMALLKRVEKEAACIEIEGLEKNLLNKIWQENRLPHTNLPEELYNSIMGYICDVIDRLSIYKVYPDLYEGNDKQEALAWCLTKEATSLEVDGIKLDVQNYFDEQNLRTRMEAFLNYIADSHIKIVSTTLYDYGEKFYLYTFKHDGGISVALAYKGEENVVFLLKDRQGCYPQRYEDVSDYEWVVGNTGLDAVMINGFPRVARDKNEVKNL